MFEERGREPIDDEELESSLDEELESSLDEELTGIILLGLECEPSTTSGENDTLLPVFLLVLLLPDGPLLGTLLLVDDT